MTTPQVLPTKMGRPQHMPEKHNIMQTDPPGVNQGGTCLSCGTNLRFWYHYKACDRCLEIDSNAVRQL